MNASKTVRVSVVSPEHEVFAGEANMIYVRGVMGEMGIAPGHLQLLTTLKPGPVRISHGDGVELLYVSGGILEVQPDMVTILADSIERPQDVNEAAAKEARDAAQALLSNREVTQDHDQIQQQLLEAMAKLEVIELMRNRKKY